MVTVTTELHSPRSQLGVQSRAFPYLSIVLSGSYREHIGSAVVECQPMEMRLHPASEEHGHVIGSFGARCMVLELGKEWHESVKIIVSGLNHPLLVRAPVWWPDAVRANHRAARDGSDVMLESWTARLMELCERQARIERAADRSRTVQRAIASIDERLDQRLSLVELASEAGLHPTHFARSFKSLTGHTVGEYIRQRRLARAQQLLVAKASFTLSRIAVESGFFDHAHLTRSFCRAVGVSPSEYRCALARMNLIDID